MIKKCKKCFELKEHHAKGFCAHCYKKFFWKPKKAICKRCKREMPIHAKGLCPGCYNFVFHLDKNKAFNQLKNYGINYISHKKITEKCIVCGFEKIVEMHHLDENKENNSISNLIGLCPNHHKMFHNFQFKKEILNILLQKGYFIKKDPKLDFKL